MASNILLITADQWRGDCAGFAGHPMVRTPHIDALAGAGVSFDRHYTVTCPCGPARASLYTGLYPHNHRSFCNGTPLDDRWSNLALDLRRGGYDPIVFGYTDTSVDPGSVAENDPRLTTYEGFLPGFSVGVDMTGSMAPWIDSLRRHGHRITGPGYGAFRPVGGPLPAGRGITWHPTCFPAEHSETAWLVDQTIDHLRAHAGTARDRPFCVHLSLLRPHPPFTAPAPYHDMYVPADMPAPIQPLTLVEAAAQHPFTRHVFEMIRQRAFFAAGKGTVAELGDLDMRQIRATYYGLVSEVDANLGRLFAALEALGVFDDTLIVLTSDHGEQLGDHRLLGKLGWHDESYHIPLVIRDPRRPDQAGRRVGAFTESVDVMPTILDWAGCAGAEQSDGTSLAGWVAGETPPNWRRGVHWRYDFRDRRGAMSGDALDAGQAHLQVYRDDHTKYVQFAAWPPLLFDLAEDPFETRNLADDPAHAGQARDCAQGLLTWLMGSSKSALDRLLLTRDGVRPA